MVDQALLQQSLQDMLSLQTKAQGATSGFMGGNPGGAYNMPGMMKGPVGPTAPVGPQPPTNVSFYDNTMGYVPPSMNAEGHLRVPAAQPAEPMTFSKEVLGMLSSIQRPGDTGEFDARQFSSGWMPPVSRLGQFGGLGGPNAGWLPPNSGAGSPVGMTPANWGTPNFAPGSFPGSYPGGPTSPETTGTPGVGIGNGQASQMPGRMNQGGGATTQTFFSDPFAADGSGQQGQPTRIGNISSSPTPGVPMGQWMNENIPQLAAKLGFEVDGSLPWQQIADWFIPGNAWQNGEWNVGNVVTSVLSQLFGLPITQLADKFANTEWVQTSDNWLAKKLKAWDAQNDDAALNDWYQSNGITNNNGQGWMSPQGMNFGAAPQIARTGVVSYADPYTGQQYTSTQQLPGATPSGTGTGSGAAPWWASQGPSGAPRGTPGNPSTAQMVAGGGGWAQTTPIGLAGGSAIFGDAARSMMDAMKAAAFQQKQTGADLYGNPYAK